MAYWLPPPLALPRGTKTLRTLPGPLDRGAAWLINRRMAFYKEGDPYTLSSDEWNMLRYIRDKSYHQPSWMAAQNPPSRQRRKLHLYSRATSLDGWTAFLPTWQAGPRHHIVAMPFVSAKGWAGSDDDERMRAFFVARQEGDRWRFYPRTIRSKAYDARASTIIRARSMERLIPLWDAAFDALPAYTTTRAEQHAGHPYLAASLPAWDRYEEPQHTPHPFWRYAQHALCAAFSLERLAPPPPPDRYSNTFHWTVMGNAWSPYDREPLSYTPFPLRIKDLHWDGWTTVTSEDIRIPTPEIQAGITRITLAMETVLNQFAPDVPFFFETVEMRQHGHSFSNTPDADVYGTGQHFPWITDEMFKGAGTAHHAMRHLRALPPEWAQALTRALAAHTP